MVEFIDKTTGQDGTPINRRNLMAMQGFIAKDTFFDDDGSIKETNKETNEVLTTEFDVDAEGNDIVIETFTGEKTITKTTTFKADGTITEVIS